MTREARLTQQRLEGEILKLLEGEGIGLFHGTKECSFCQKYGVKGRGVWIGQEFYFMEDCSRCPINIHLGSRCNNHSVIETIDSHMENCTTRAIPGALAIYMWLFEL